MADRRTIPTGSLAPFPKTVRERAMRFLSSPPQVKYFMIMRRFRKWLPHIRVPLQLSFGSWWLALDSALDSCLQAGSFEAPESAFLHRFLQEGMTVMDIGAHHGYYTLLSSVLVGRSGRVVAFEPSARERVRLIRHVRLNRYANVQVEAFALGAEKANRELFVADGKQDWCNSLRPPAIESATMRVPVGVTTVDEFLALEGIKKVDFIKLDVEGGELDVLRGAVQLLEDRPRPIVLAEVQDIRTAPWGYAAREIIELMVGHSYSWYTIALDGSLEALDVSASQYDGNFVAWPKERPAEHLRVPQ